MTIRSEPGVKRILDCPFSETRFEDRFHGPLAIGTEKGAQLISRMSFALLDAVFTSHGLCVSESGSCVRLIDVASGQVLWRYDPPDGQHVVELGYDQASDTLLGVQWPYRHGGAKALLQFDSGSGESSLIGDLGIQACTAYVPIRNQIVCGDGTVFSAFTGRVENHDVFGPGLGE